MSPTAISAEITQQFGSAPTLSNYRDFSNELRPYGDNASAIKLCSFMVPEASGWYTVVLWLSCCKISVYEWTGGHLLRCRHIAHASTNALMDRHIRTSPWPSIRSVVLPNIVALLRELSAFCLSRYKRRSRMGSPKRV